VSHATARELIDLRLARSDQIAVIPSGVNVRQEPRAGTRSAARKRLGLPASASVAGWVGRHFDQKRPEQVCAIARRVTDELHDAHVVLVGDGPGLETSRAACAGQDRIHVLGYRDDVDEIYEALDVMYLASAWEGLPRTILEAMAAGVPVVSTDVSGVSEVVREGETGFLVPADEPEFVADRILDLLADRALIKRLGGEARATITREYSTTFMIEATATLYDNLLSR
jgi:glycosyltransferase involved in cell wall biosynthesis